MLIFYAPKGFFWQVKLSKVGKHSLTLKYNNKNHIFPRVQRSIASEAQLLTRFFDLPQKGFLLKHQGFFS